MDELIIRKELVFVKKNRQIDIIKQNFGSTQIYKSAR